MPRAIRPNRHSILAWCAGLALASLLASPAWAQQDSFVAFESGPVRPLALSSDGTRLYAVNTPDNRLEIFDVDALGVSYADSVPVGMEPVAVAESPTGEVWVVNHLSDSVSIVDPATMRVTRTLLVGDEPRDIVFAGTVTPRAFITTARRGQHRTHPSIAAAPGAGDPLFTTEGTPRADVWIFDAANPGPAIGGVPLKIVELFGDTPRALAVSPDGATVYAAIHYSGNQTTALNDGFICPGFDPLTPCLIAGVLPAPGGQLGPATNHAGEQAPEVGLILKFDQPSGEWRDVIGRDWSLFVRFDLPDKDVFSIDADTLLESSFWSGVGTTIFNMVAHPSNGKVYVSNTDSRNEVRFEGPGIFGGTTVQGHLAESRITVLDGASVLPRHLNKHIDYSTLAAEPGFDPNARLHSLATPLDMVIASDGTLYVAAFGSARVGVFSTAALDSNSFDPPVDSASYIDVSGGGPAGLALDEPRNRLYVWTRFDNGISVVDLASGTETDHVNFYNPEPASIVEGRPFLYDAFETSGNGEASCSSCHIFGGLDQLAWDLGNPDDDVTTNPLSILNPGGAAGAPSPINGTGNVDDFHPMKGPMTTQTLRGMDGHGALHWRGDRSNGFFGINALDEDLSFRNFIVAFEGLVGREAPISDSDMQKFADFALAMELPPNPVRPLDNQLTLSQQAGRDFYFNNAVDGPLTCNNCHRTEPENDFFGSGRFSTFEGSTQIFKVPHLRNMYDKVGMFGFLANFGTGTGLTGDQVRGYGYLHDGSVDSLFRFVSANAFNFPDEASRRDMENFMLAFDTEFAPIVGQQVTRDSVNGADVDGRIDMFMQRDDADECDVVAKASVDGTSRGFARLPDGTFQSDRFVDVVTEAQLRGLADTAGQEVTFTCSPPGSGHRMGVDRDEDGFLDTDELDEGSDPADPASVPAGTIPAACPPAPRTDCLIGSKSTVSIRVDDNPDRDRLKWKIIRGEPFSSAELGDPQATTTYRLCIYDRGLGLSSLAGEVVAAPSPNWENRGSKGWRYKDKNDLQDGIRKLDLKTSDQVKSKVSITARGAGIPLSPPAAPAAFYELDPDVTVQLMNDETPICWTSGFDESKRNDEARFKAKAP